MPSEMRKVIAENLAFSAHYTPAAMGGVQREFH
jgi:hypothetical protein